MRHLKRGRRLGRNSSHRKAMWRNMTVSLFLSEAGRIVTTEPKAKELRRYAERLITLAKRGGEANKRRAFSRLRSKECVEKLFEDIAPQFADRPGGYTRIIKWDKRLGDKAQRVVFELCTEENAFPDDGRVPVEPKVSAPVAESTEEAGDAPAEDVQDPCVLL